MSNYHEPVLKQQTIDYLQIKPGNTYIDATLGGGGHTFEILKRGAHVIGIDADEDATRYVTAQLGEKEIKKLGEKYDQAHDINITQYTHIDLVRANFSQIDFIVEHLQINKVSGILFDLGVSSFQIDTKERGFSFLKNGPLDMRMDKRLGVTAKDLLHALSKSELTNLFFKLGEEQNSRNIAEAIVKARETQKIETTEDLITIIAGVYKIKGQLLDKTKADISKRIFQALRIAVNDELTRLSEGLEKGLEVLEENGRLVVISFHSLEDRIVKDTFKKFEDEKKGIVVTKKPIIATEEEIAKNSRARSAKLRVFEKMLKI
jgi:16S rRNA (cytosine1402-N4)-methyltransferase